MSGSELSCGTQRWGFWAVWGERLCLFEVQFGCVGIIYQAEIKALLNSSWVNWCKAFVKGRSVLCLSEFSGSELFVVWLCWNYDAKFKTPVGLCTVHNWIEIMDMPEAESGKEITYSMEPLRGHGIIKSVNDIVYNSQASGSHYGYAGYWNCFWMRSLCTFTFQFAITRTLCRERDVLTTHFTRWYILQCFAPNPPTSSCQSSLLCDKWNMMYCNVTDYRSTPNHVPLWDRYNVFFIFSAIWIQALGKSLAFINAFSS